MSENLCTFFPDELGEYDFQGCCKCHDDHYDQKDISRKEADYELRW